MMFTKVLSWILFVLSAIGCVYILWIFGWLLFYPAIDPMPVVLGMFFRLAALLVAIVLTGICYVVCRIARI